MIRTILAVILYTIVIYALGIWSAYNQDLAQGWWIGRWEYATHIYKKECKTPEGWYPCNQLEPKK